MEDKSDITQILKRGDYLSAAVAVFQSAQQSGDIDSYIQAALYFLQGGQAHLSREIAVQLSETDAREMRRFHVLMAFIFLLSEQPSDAREVLEVLSASPTDNAWASLFLGSEGENPLQVMAREAVFRPTISKSAVILAEHVVHFRMLLECPACNTMYPASIQKSIFQLAFAPCPSCLQPYLVTPSALSRSLNEHNTTYDIQELWKIDELCRIWIYNWNQQLETPPAARHKYSDDIFELATNTLRFALSEHYVDLFNQERRKVDLS